jgi:arginine N-succinyltransferase
VTIGDAPADAPSYIVSNTQLANYRATAANLAVSEDNDNVILDAETAAGLMVADGEQIRVLAM